MKIHEILNEKYSLTAECNNMARFHTHDYYNHLTKVGAVDQHGKGILPYDASKWNYECQLNADYIEDKNSNFYVLANNVSINYSLSQVNNEATTYQDYIERSRPGIKTFEAHFDSDNSAINVVIDPMLLDVREQNLQFIIYRVLMHEISHVYHYSRTLTNFELGGRMPEQNKKYHARSFEIDARYRDGWASVFYFEKVKKRVATSNEAWEILRQSILRHNAYKISPGTLDKYQKKFYQDYRDHIGSKQ